MDKEAKACTCDAWKENIKHLNAMAFMAWNHRMEYQGARFEYCPWCGKLLIPESELNESRPNF
jgi:hypothetical protein